MLIKIGLLLLFLFFTAGCEQTFDPIQENDQYPFSIHGYLDASAGNNWVRVTEVRDTLFMRDPNSSIDAVVTLEDLESGEEVTMKDSLHRFFNYNFAFNFWSDMDLEPEKTYRLKAERSNGTTSSATVTTPPEFTDPYIKYRRNPPFGRDTLVILDVRHLADVVVIYHVDAQYPGAHGVSRNEHRFRHIADTSATLSDTQVLIFDGLHFTTIRGHYGSSIPYTIVYREIKVSSAGPDWLYFSSLDENLVSLAEGTSNVDNGAGYVVGIVSKKIPYEL